MLYIVYKSTYLYLYL